jgi:CheY-like chemotaxis protein
MAAPIRVMLVDDYESYRRLLRRLLELEGLEVVGEGGDGAAGVRAAHYCRPDVIVSDYRMPLMDGLTMARWITSEPNPPPIILLSCESREILDADARAAGVVMVLDKGCPVEELTLAIRKVTALPTAPFPNATPSAATSAAHLRDVPPASRLSTYAPA